MRGFLNEDKKTLRGCSADEIATIIRSGIDGCEVWYSGMWNDLSGFRESGIYRTKVKRWEPKSGDYYINGRGSVYKSASIDSRRLFGGEFETQENAEGAWKDFLLLHLMYQAWREIEGWDAKLENGKVEFTSDENLKRYEQMIAPWVEELK